MSIAAIIVFAIAAALGSYMASLHFRGRRPALALAFSHITLAVVGIALLLIAVLRGALPRMGTWALVAFGLAAVGGLVLLLPARLRGEMPRRLFIVGHALIAVGAFVLLLIAVLG